MFYKMNQDKIEETDVVQWQKGKEGIAVFSEQQWQEMVDIRTTWLLNQREDNIHFCKLESHGTYLFGTFHIPIREQYEKNFRFAFYILDRKLIFIDDTGLVKNSIVRLAREKHQKGYVLERFLYDFLMLLIEEDLLYLADIEKEITKMEEQILHGNMEQFSSRMLRMKKEISRMYRYYSQLSDLGENLYENHTEVLLKKETERFRIFSDRVMRLQQETQILREYAMQVQDVYQSEISIRQNDVMKVLTIVTTIFLPLTLIVGWYGMNFVYMPELAWKYAYPCVIGVSVLIVVLNLIVFKKRNYM